MLHHLYNLRLKHSIWVVIQVKAGRTSFAAILTANTALTYSYLAATGNAFHY